MCDYRTVLVMSEENGEKCLLAVQLGNAETSCGVFLRGKLVAHWTTATRVRATSDDLEAGLRMFLASKDAPAPNQAILCSVVPLAADAWEAALEAVCGCRVLSVGPGLKTGLSLKYKDPAQVGADRVVCAVAAKHLYGAGVIVVDFNHSATAFSVIDRKGAFAGGVIAPGLAVSLNALASSAAQLVLPTLHVPDQVLGRSTPDAIVTGVVLGEVFRADGFVEALWNELGEKTQLVATGRFASLVVPRSAHDFAVEPYLALLGLHRLWELNGK